MVEGREAERSPSPTRAPDTAGKKRGAEQKACAWVGWAERADGMGGRGEAGVESGVGPRIGGRGEAGL